MRRGTTPTHTFELPFDTGVVKNVSIIYAQKSHLKTVKIVKTKEECTLEKNTVRVTLSQADTLSLTHNMPVRIQLRILADDNTALVSDIIELTVDPCLDDEVLV